MASSQRRSGKARRSWRSQERQGTRRRSSDNARKLPRVRRRNCDCLCTRSATGPPRWHPLVNPRSPRPGPELRLNLRRQPDRRGDTDRGGGCDRAASNSRGARRSGSGQVAGACQRLDQPGNLFLRAFDNSSSTIRPANWRYFIISISSSARSFFVGMATLLKRLLTPVLFSSELLASETLFLTGEPPAKGTTRKI